MLESKRRGNVGKMLCPVWHSDDTGNWKTGNGIFLSGSASGCLLHVQEITLHLCFHFLGCQMNIMITTSSECSCFIRAIKHFRGRSHRCVIY